MKTILNRNQAAFSLEVSENSNKSHNLYCKNHPGSIRITTLMPLEYEEWFFVKYTCTCYK